MATKANSTTALQHIRKLGETAGAGAGAQFKAVKYFSEYANNTVDFIVSDAICSQYANEFADGQQSKLPDGETIKPKSREQYASQMKLWAEPNVYKRLSEIEKESLAFVASTTAEQRGDRRFFGIAKAVASKVRKDGGVAIDAALFAKIAPPKTAPTPPAAADLALQTRNAFKAVAVDLQKHGVATPDMMAHLSAIATALNVNIDYAAPAAPAAPDLASIIAAAVAQAMAAVGK